VSGLAMQHVDADAGFAGVGRCGHRSKDEPLEVVMASAEPKPDFERQWRRRESNPRKVPRDASEPTGDGTSVDAALGPLAADGNASRAHAFGHRLREFIVFIDQDGHFLVARDVDGQVTGARPARCQDVAVSLRRPHRLESGQTLRKRPFFSTQRM
jgi:hypothetical protein